MELLLVSIGFIIVWFGLSVAKFNGIEEMMDKIRKEIEDEKNNQ